MARKRQSPAAAAKVFSTGLALTATLGVTALLGHRSRTEHPQASQPSLIVVAAATQASSQAPAGVPTASTTSGGTLAPAISNTQPAALALAAETALPLAASPASNESAFSQPPPAQVLEPAATSAPIVQPPAAVVLEVPTATSPPAPPTSGSR